MLFEPADGDWTNYVRPPTNAKLTTALVALRALLGGARPADWRDRITKAIAAVLRALWYERWSPTRSNPFVDPTMCFIAVFFLREDGGFETASGVPYMLTRLVYFMRCLVLYDAHAASTAQADIIDQLNTLHTHIEEGQESTFSAVWGLQAYAKAISMSSIGLPRVWYTEKGRKHFTELHYKNRPFSLADNAKWNGQIQGKVVSSLTDLGVDRSNAIPFNSGATGHGNLVDDAECSAVYYSLFTELENQRAWTGMSAALLQKLLNTPGFVDADGKLVLTRWMRWFATAAEGELNLMLSALNNEGSPSRATEHVNMLAANSGMRQRNLVDMSPNLCIAAGYSKSTSVTGLDKSILKGLDAFTSWGLFQFHILIRPIQIFVAQFLFPSTAPTVIHQLKTMLFMDNGKPFTSSKLTAHMEATSEVVFGWGITPNPHRHIQTALHRDHVPKVAEILDDTEYRTMSALQAGHSLHTEETVYGLPGGTITGDSQAVAEAYISVSKAWQQAMGVVPTGTPVVYGADAYVNWIDPSTRAVEPPAQNQPPVQAVADPIMLQMLQTLLDGSQSANAKLDAQATEIASLKAHVTALSQRQVLGNFEVPPPPPQVPETPAPELFAPSWSPAPPSPARASPVFAATNPVDDIMDEDQILPPIEDEEVIIQGTSTKLFSELRTECICIFRFGYALATTAYVIHWRAR